MKKVLGYVLAVLGLGGAMLGGGYYNATNTSRVQSGIVTTTDATSTTLKTIPVSGTTSTVQLAFDVSANGATSTLYGGWHCTATFKKTAPNNIPVLVQVGSTNCNLNRNDTMWQADVSTTPSNILIQAAGRGGNTINWNAYSTAIEAN